MAKSKLVTQVLILMAGFDVASLLAKDPVELRALAENTLICKESGGSYTMWATIRIKHTNTGERPLIVPRLISISGYRVEDMDGKTILRVKDVFDDLSGLSTDNWNGVAPKQGLFDTLKPSQSREIQGMMLRVPIAGGDGKRRPRVGPGRYRLFIHVNHNGRSQRPSALSSDRWPVEGVLLHSTIEADPIEIEIPSSLPKEACGNLFKM